MGLGAFGVAGSLMPAACSSDVAPSDPRETLSEKRDSLLSPWGAEKLIPLRVVHLTGCTPTGTATCGVGPNCGDDNICYDSLLDSVTKANHVFKAAGVQFVEVDKKAFYDATKPVRDKYGSKYAALIKRIEDTK